jgi:hypothetical protein
MRLPSKTVMVGLGAAVACAAFNACTYDFDGLVAQPGGGGAAGLGGLGGLGGAAGADGGGAGGSAGIAGTGGTATGGAAGNAGTAGSGGSGGTAVDAGKGGNAGAGKGGNAGTVDAASDRGPDAIADVRSEPAFDCAAVMGTVFQSHCYYPSSATTNWDNANTMACAAPSHLAVITTSGEQGIVAALLAGKDRWIGMRKDAGSPNMKSSLHWVTGEAITYEIWDTYETGAPEPNFTGDCVRMRPTNNWGDTACTEMYSAVCERE